jgi:hypothetical protein
MSSQSKAARESTATSRVNRGDNTLLYYARAYAGRGLVLNGRPGDRMGSAAAKGWEPSPSDRTGVSNDGIDANSKATRGINAKARSVRAGAVE